jgi:hypothetical protein
MLAFTHRVKKLVALYEGSVDAHSEGVGRGSKFMISLPTLRHAPAPLEAHDQEPLPIKSRSMPDGPYRQTGTRR